MVTKLLSATEKKAILLLGLGDSFISLASYISTPYISLYLLKNTQYKSDSIGWVLGLSSLIGVISAIFGGYLSDRLGRATLIFYSLVGAAIIYTLYFLCSLYLSKIFLLISFTILGGLISSCVLTYHPVSYALITDYFPHEKKAVCFQIRYMAANIGELIAPLIALGIGVAAKRSAFLVSAFLYIIYAVLIFIFTNRINFFQSQIYLEKTSIVDISKLIVSDYRLRAFILSGFALSLCCIQFETSLSQYLNILSHNAIQIYSVLITTSCITLVVTQWIFFKKTLKIKANTLICLGCLIVGIGFYIISFSHVSLFYMYLGVIIFSIGEVLIFPSYGRYLASISPIRLRGAYFGASFLRLTGTFIGPIIGGYCLRYYNGQILFIFTAFVAILASLIQVSSLLVSSGKSDL